MSTPIKSKYELILEELGREGKVKTFSAEQNLAIIAELNKGMDEFLSQQKKNEKASAQELKEIVLNA